jgi:glycosyltransferase involved in cell wall biosynthesis
MIGLPVISTNWRSIPELVGNGGLLVEPKAANEIVEAIEVIASKHQLYRERSIARADLFDDSVNTSDFMKKIGFNNEN